MKKLFLILPVLIFLSCSKEEKLELYNPEGFAFQLDSGYELNGSVRVKGFKQVEENDKYTAKLSYSVDIITPSGDTLKNADSGLLDNEGEEEAMDLAVELQVEFDSTFGKGNYIIIYNVEDNLKPQAATLIDTVKID